MKQPRFTKMSAAAKVRAAARQRTPTGTFAAKDQAMQMAGDSVRRADDPVLPVSSDVDYPSLFVASPNPVNGIFYNPDVAFNSNPENASRMIQDMAIYSALQERQLATAALPWSIVPTNEEDAEQQAAAEAIEDVIRSRTPNLLNLFRHLLDSIWFGRAGAYFRYEWDFSNGRRLMVPAAWTPVHGDTIVFADDGRVGYRVGATLNSTNVTVGVTGRTVMVGEVPLTSQDAQGEEEGQKPDDKGNLYLQPAQRKAWVVHHGQITAGEFQVFTSAASMWGLGLRSRIYPIWLLKQSCLQFAMQAAEKFGSGWLIGYFDGGNPASAEAVRNALQKQVGSTVQMFPRFAPDSDAIEGLEIVDPPSGGSELREWVDYYDGQIHKTICSQSLTSDNEHGSGLGSNLADVQQSTFGRLIKFDSAALGETMTKQFVSVLQEFNGYGHLPPLRLEFSFDIGSTTDKLEMAKLLHEMGVELDHEELRQAAGFTKPSEDQVMANGAKISTETNIDTSDMNATGEIDTVPESSENVKEAENAEV